MSSLEPFFSSPIGSNQGDLRPSEDVDHRNVAAIDIGTNSTHLLVASVDPVLHTFSIDLAEKSTTRLGERDPDSGALTEIAMDRVLEALHRFQDLAESHRVEQMIITATSAVREAPNGRDFINRVKEKL